MRSLIISLIIIFSNFILLGASENPGTQELSGYPDESSEELLKLKENPLNINEASFTEFYLLPWLDTDQINKIVKYRKENEIKNLKQLRKIGIEEITLNEIKDYIVFKNKPVSNLLNIIRVELDRGRLDYPSCLKYYAKAIYKRGNLEAGLISQKDEGEKDPFDYLSYYFVWKNLGFLKKIILGKFQIKSGQGITMFSKLGSCKSTSATSTPVNKKTVIKPYTSSYEIWALEGVCADIQLGKFTVIPFLVGFHSPSSSS